MAGQGPLLKSLAVLVAGFDTNAWESLANKGLVRRAQKDLESGLEIEVEEEADALRFKILTYAVTMPVTGPAKATCTCPARGVCQHVLAAGMWLQRMPRDDGGVEDVDLASPEQMEQQMLAMTVEELEKWGGVAAVREGWSLAAGGKIDRQTNGAVVVDFPDQGIKTRFVPGGGLDGIMVSGAARNRQPAAAIAAVLCVHLSHGRSAPEEVITSKALEEAAQAPRTRDEILQAAQAVIEEALQVGLTHVSNSLTERLQTLGMSAQATNLPRLARTLKALADEAGAIVGRLGRASESRLLLAMARAYALTEALKKPEARSRADLVGVHRTQYEEVSRLDLLGAAAYPWQTASGYLGLTVLYWDPRNQAWFSWTDARPATQAAGFDPASRFQGAGPWEGIESPVESARSRIALIGPRRNPEGRLSSSSSTKAMVLGPATASDFDFGPKLFTDWAALRAYVAGVFPIGLRELHPLDLIVALQPWRFGRRNFDEQRQLFRWDLLDQDGSSFPLVIPFREWTAQAIKYLENLNPSANSNPRFVVKIHLSEIGLAAEPLALHLPDASGGAIVHLAFSEGNKGEARKPSALKKVLDLIREGDDEWDAEDIEELAPAIPRIVESLLNRIEKEIERAAESGAAGLDAAALIPMRREAERLGLTPLMRVLNGAVEGPFNHARMILKIRYVCSLYCQSATFA